MKDRWVTIISWVGLAIVILVALRAIWVWAEMTGEIPVMIDSTDGWYKRVVNIKPTSGKIWYSSVGFLRVSNFIRLRLSRADFGGAFRSDAMDPFFKGLPIPPGPIWWNPDSRDQCFHYQTKFEEIWIFYDPERELLFEKIDL